MMNEALAFVTSSPYSDFWRKRAGLKDLITGASMCGQTVFSGASRKVSVLNFMRDL